MKKIIAITFSFTLLCTTIFAQCDNLVLDLPFSGNANDITSHSNNGTVTGAILTSDRFGNANSAYYFDGIDDHILINDHSSLDLDIEWTIIAWVKPESGYGNFKDNHVSIVDKWGNGGVGNAAYTMSIHTGGYMEGLTYNGTSGTYTYTDGIVPEEEWTQLVITRDVEHTLKYYINGILDKEILDSKIPQNSIFDLKIGMVGSQITQNAYPSFYRFNGVIDDVKIYKCTLPIEDFAYEPLNIEEDYLADIKLYPNPITNTLNIESKNKGAYYIYSVLGKKALLSGNIQTGKTELDISLLNTGVYIFKIFSKEGLITTQKFIKQ